MKWSLLALAAGFCIDLVVGDPHGIPHPVVGIGKLISFFEKILRRLFPKTVLGENIAGGILWVMVAAVSTAVPVAALWLCHRVSPWLRLAVESVMCWQILATKSLRDESMRVFYALEAGDPDKARRAVSMIVGRDTQRLDDGGVTRAAVETVAENTSDGVVAPMLFAAVGGAPLGFFYKAVNTMDSMLGYVEPPYKNIGLVPANMDDLMNFVPARLSAFLMLAAGWLLGMDVKNGWKIFRRTDGPAAGGRRLVSRCAPQKAVHRRPCPGDHTPGYPQRLPSAVRHSGSGAAAVLRRKSADPFVKGGSPCFTRPSIPTAATCTAAR